MKFFIDTANLDEIREAASWGVLDGVTTNPSLIAKEKKAPRELFQEICEVVNGPVSAEVVSVESQGMLREGHELRRIHKNIVIKVPLTSEGLKACKILASEGTAVNVTLCFSPTQALLAAKVGAAYISPFIGRLDDISHQGMDIVRHIRKIYDNYGFKTQVLVASIRHPLHVLEAALIGAEVVTCPFKVIEGLVKHPLTEIGLARFLKDWEKVPELAEIFNKRS
jgi:transaldolase